VSHPVDGEGGSLNIGTTMDVTERREAEEALRQASADLARASRITLMGELTASLAHELNQPITAAVTNANACLRWLAAAPPNLGEARAAVADIVSDGTRAAEIISRTRRLFEKGAPQPEPIEVDDVVRETVLMLGGEASRSAVSIRTFLAAGFPEVRGDRVQLQQVLMNLIANGIDAVKEVDGAREISIKSQRTDDDEIMVSVSDTGVGLPAADADRLFSTFFTTKPHGTGMGLAISRSIISAHGGRLWAEPNHPRGAVFRFILPTASEPATP
jgi:C4-dicarboxylate-specific signal transduction histidine kinase